MKNKIISFIIFTILLLSFSDSSALYLYEGTTSDGHSYSLYADGTPPLNGSYEDLVTWFTELTDFYSTYDPAWEYNSSTKKYTTTDPNCPGYLDFLTVPCTPDNTPPTISANKSEAKWKNNIGDITLTTDANIYSKYIWDSNTCVSNGTSFNNGDKIQVPGEGKHKLYLCAETKANECSDNKTSTWEGDYWLDQTSPNTIIFDKENIKAQDYTYNLKIDNSGDYSPIKSIKVLVEDENNKDNFPIINESSPTKSGNNYIFSFLWGMKNVDNVSSGDIVSNGARKYTIKVNEVCDEAGNCSTNQVSKDHNVYANQIDKNKSILDYSELTSGKVADGTDSELKLILKDEFGNIIIPVNLNGFTKKVKTTYVYNNSLHKNQFTNLQTDSAVYYNGSKLPIQYESFVKNSTNGDYSVNFNVYAPTNNLQFFNITNINAFTSTEGTTDFGNIDFNFKPLYKTTFSGEQTEGLKEGITQSGSVIIFKETSLINPTSKKIYLQKDGVQKDEFNGKAKIGNNSFVDIYTNPSLLNDFTENTNYILNTLFTLVPGSSSYIDDIKDVDINSWIGYNIGSITGILYQSDSIVKNNNQDNIGIKIFGNSNIDKSKQKDLTRNQDNKDVKNINGTIDKASVKKIIRQNVYSSIKNINSDENGITFGDIIYYDLRNSNNKTKELSTSDLETNKTIIVLGGNLYITGSSTTGNYFPGIIILKDNNGNGGKLYIDPEVSKINAALYVDKSVISYNSIWGEISAENGGTYSVLKNQLYINGSLFSENTIGGSRLNPPVCPFYVTETCTIDNAQKYDLNYLRRGIENQVHTSNYPVVIEYNSQLQLNPPALFSN